LQGTSLLNKLLNSNSVLCLYSVLYIIIIIIIILCLLLLLLFLLLLLLLTPPPPARNPFPCSG
jgi:hypothetical protein